MAKWTYQNILQLAPDALVLEKAKRLAQPRRWAIAHQNEGYLWGTCKSSGTITYEVAIDLDGPVYACTCQSTKQPCRHSLALFLLFAERKDAVRYESQTPADLPSFLAAAKENDSVQPTNTDTKASNKASRIVQMVAGAVELEQWLLDLIRYGFGQAQSQEAAFWEGFAAQMVDAKLGGVARRIRLMPQWVHRQDWPALMAQEVANLYLLAQALKKQELLNEDLREELLATAGMNQSKTEVMEQKGIRDHWLVIGQRISDEENLQARRTWLLGEKSQETALILDFAWGNQGFPIEWIVGSVVTGAIAFYPGSFRQRALVQQFELSTAPFRGLIGFADFETLAKAYAEALATNPWLYSFPTLLEAATPIRQEQEMGLVDSHQKYLPLSIEMDNFWKLMAISGGHPLQIFGEWTGSAFLPLTLFSAGRIIEL
jgi:hypothetical protein